MTHMPVDSENLLYDDQSGPRRLWPGTVGGKAVTVIGGQFNHVAHVVPLFSGVSVP
jgi:hypothetical protein